MTLHFGSSLSRQETPPGGTLQRTLPISCYLASQHSSQGSWACALVRPTRHNSRFSLKPKVSFLKFRVFESQISETSSAFLVFVHTTLLLYVGSSHRFLAFPSSLTSHLYYKHFGPRCRVAPGKHTLLFSKGWNTFPREKEEVHVISLRGRLYPGSWGYKDILPFMIYCIFYTLTPN